MQVIPAVHSKYELLWSRLGTFERPSYNHVILEFCRAQAVLCCTLFWFWILECIVYMYWALLCAQVGRRQPVESSTAAFLQIGRNWLQVFRSIWMVWHRKQSECALQMQACEHLMNVLRYPVLNGLSCNMDACFGVFVYVAACMHKYSLSPVASTS